MTGETARTFRRVLRELTSLDEQEDEVTIRGGCIGVSVDAYRVAVITVEDCEINYYQEYYHPDGERSDILRYSFRCEVDANYGEYGRVLFWRDY